MYVKLTRDKTIIINYNRHKLFQKIRNKKKKKMKSPEIVRT